MSAKTLPPGAAEPALFDVDPAPVATPRPRRPRPPAPEPVAEEVVRILQHIDTKPEHAVARSLVVRAIVQDARANNGRVDPNRVRARLAGDNGRPAVAPQVVGATYYALAVRGVLVFHDWVLSTDTASRNAGKPIKSYRLARIPAADTAA